jgi:23S rRNA (uracil1939-C5)-methyltransferase
VRSEGKVFASRHQKGSDEADIPVTLCFLQSPVTDRIMNLTAELATEYSWTLYDPTSRSGWLKHLLVREGKETGQFLVALVTDEGKVDGLSAWSERLQKEIPEVVSIYHSHSWGASNTRFDDTLLWGAPGITEKVGEYTFWISPHSFFQTNGKQVHALYSLIAEHAALGGTEHLWDMYAGSATIGIFLSKLCKKVTSIESNTANVGDAAWNLHENSVVNVEIVEGQVEDVVTSAFAHERGLPDVVVVDPPRAGLHERFRTMLPNLGAKRIVYVSCNPATCLRDLRDITRSGYKVVQAQGIDMFPHTSHCEVVITLEK